MHSLNWSRVSRHCHKEMSNRLSLNCGLALLIALAVVLPVRAAGPSDYGAYLSGECMGCHRPGGTPSAIPALETLSPDRIIAALREYQSGKRTNPVMVSVARSLSEEQIAALAAFFSAAKP